jgi:ABC-type multidrug transport system fused ATPase/permease subunit
MIYDKMTTDQQWWFIHYLTVGSNMGRGFAYSVFFAEYLSLDPGLREAIAPLFLAKYQLKNPMRNPVIRVLAYGHWNSLRKLHQKFSGQGRCPFLGTDKLYGISSMDLRVAETVLISEAYGSFLSDSVFPVILGLLALIISCMSTMSILFMFGFNVVPLLMFYSSLMLIMAANKYTKLERKYRQENEAMAAFLLKLVESSQSPLWWITQNISEDS